MPQIKQHRVADNADQLRANRLDEECRDLVASDRTILAVLHLDEFVGLECKAGCVNHPGDEAVLTDEHDRLEVMRERTQVAALLPGQWRLRIHVRSIQCRASAHKREAPHPVGSLAIRQFLLILCPASSIIPP